MWNLSKICGVWAQIKICENLAQFPQTSRRSDSSDNKNNFYNFDIFCICVFLSLCDVHLFLYLYFQSVLFVFLILCKLLDIFPRASAPFRKFHWMMTTIFYSTDFHPPNPHLGVFAQTHGAKTFWHLSTFVWFWPWKYYIPKKRNRMNGKRRKAVLNWFGLFHWE